jgi:hypothetical protein
MKWNQKCYLRYTKGPNFLLGARIFVWPDIFLQGVGSGNGTSKMLFIQRGRVFYSAVVFLSGRIVLRIVDNTGIPWCFFSSTLGRIRYVPDGLSAALVDDDGLLAAQAAHLEALQGLHAPRLVHRHNVAPQALQARRHRLGDLAHWGGKQIR